MSLAVLRRIFQQLLLPVFCGASHYSTMRLGSIQGYEGHANDIVYVPPTKESALTDLVVFFPGDIQNYEEEMAKDLSNHNYLNRNLESVALDLSAKLPTKHILVVKPSRSEKGGFNYYDNFVTLNKFGGPDYLKSRFALPHLCRLISNVTMNPNFRSPKHCQRKPDTSETSHCDKILPVNEESHKNNIALDDNPGFMGSSEDVGKTKCGISSENYIKSTKEKSSINPDVKNELCKEIILNQDASTKRSDDDKTTKQNTSREPESELKRGNAQDCSAGIDSIALVGFSKGCVVLNQIVTEIYLMSDLEEQERTQCSNFLQKVREMAWLDGGHQGREGTWITNPDFVKRLVSAIPGLQITIHVTPYQMFDKRRPWIGNECRKFVELCRAATNSSTSSSSDSTSTDSSTTTSSISRVTHTLHAAEEQNPTLDTHFLALDAYGN